MRPLADLLVCLRFFSRLPVPAGSGGDARHDVAAAVAMLPLAGFIIGLTPVMTLAAAAAIGLPPLLAASLAIGTLVATTGALHEDGLADCADGFGGGRDVARKLEIMRDSRIGTFGACALILALLTRVAALTTVATRSPMQGIAAILLAAIASRVAGLLPLVLLPPARPDGIGAAAGRPTLLRYALAVAITAGLGLALATLGIGAPRMAAALACTFLGAALMSLIARRHIGGQTGDVAGAAQQIAEVACLVALAAA